MKKNKTMAVLVFLFAGAAAVFAGPAREAPGENAETEIIVAAAASLADAMAEAIEAYKTAAPSVRVTASYGGSGALQRQIEQGAPVDIFFSAAPEQMNNLEKGGFVIAGTRRDILENQVVLIFPKTKTGISGFADAATDLVKQIALGEPASVPAGQYAQQIFTAMGILDAVKSKAVYAKDVRQVLAYVERGEVDAGVVYATDAAISSAVTAVPAPPASHSPVIYPAALVNTGEQPETARQFLDWLCSTQAGAIFAKYGFKTLF